MTAPQPLADGEHAGVRWYAERIPGVPAPAVRLTLQYWHHDGDGSLVSETHDLPRASRSTLLGLIDLLLCRLEAKAAAYARRTATRKARAA